MRIIFEQWRYIFKNLWFVLPFAVMPAVFLALSADFGAVSAVVKQLFSSGPFELGFAEIFFAWSFFRVNSVLGIIYGVFVLICLVIFSAFLLAFVEKHMRIGKRTMSGVFSQLRNHLLPFIGYVLFFVILYEVWALVLSAVLYAVSAFVADTVARILFVFISLIFIAVLLYTITAIYLWVPCMLHTGFGAYHAFIYSYRLVGEVRWKVILSLAISYAAIFVVLIGSAFGPHWITRLLAIVLYIFAYLSFFVRMEAIYFETDKLDREDLIRSYREL